MSKKIVEYKDLIAFHPGQYVEELIEDYNVTQKEFAERLGVSAKTVSKLVNAEESISKETAHKLAKLSGVSMQTWLNLQNAYDVKVAEIVEQKELEEGSEKEICEMIDFKYFKAEGYVPDKRYTLKEKIVELRKILGVASLEKFSSFNNQVSYRNTREFTTKSIVNSNIMLELASKKARDITTTKLNRKKLEKSLPALRELTRQAPEAFPQRLYDILLDCGVVLVGLPALPNANLNGATKKFGNGSALLLLTDRNKASDIFWFSLFHEIGHILENEFSSDDGNGKSYRRSEERADQFAKDLLIDPQDYQRFIDEACFDKQAIKKFADEIGIHPSIVLGRLQNDEYLGYDQFRDLKVNYYLVS
ncbi:MAG: HigA family addiction module antitoxin [Streptococcus sp.]|uniref:HigA family addiction module antitoxin n=1 Tax=Streptococcus sp. TaxID=1306 RepID=UPI003996C273